MLFIQPWGFDVAEINVPVRDLARRRRPPTPSLSHAEALAAKIPGAELIVWTGMGHLTSIERGKDVLGHLMAASRLMQKLFVLFHAFLYRILGGRGVGNPRAAPMKLLTTTGRKSGKEGANTPPMYFDDGDDLFLIASNGGRYADPLWYLNLRDNPNVKARIWHGRALARRPHRDRSRARPPAAQGCRAGLQGV